MSNRNSSKSSRTQNFSVERGDDGHGYRQNFGRWLFVASASAALTVLATSVGNSAAISTDGYAGALLLSEPILDWGASGLETDGKYTSLALIIKPDKPKMTRERQPHDGGNRDKPVEKRAVVSVHG